MDDSDYIKATNYEKVRITMEIVRDMVPDFDGIITSVDRALVMSILERWEHALHASVKE